MTETQNIVLHLRVINLKWSNAAADLLVQQERRAEAAEARVEELTAEVKQLQTALRLGEWIND